jgi:hypothetical protein
MVAASPVSARRGGPHSGRLELAETDDDGDEEGLDGHPALSALPAQAASQGEATPAVEPSSERTAPTSPPAARTTEPEASAQAAPQATALDTRRAGTAAAQPKRKGSGLLLLGFALLAGAVGIVVRATGNSDASAVVAAETTPPATHPALAPPAPASAAPVALAVQAPASMTGDDLPPGAEVPAGYGLLEITAPAGARVRIDGAIVGAGPAISSVAAPGYHEVRIESGGRENKSVIDVHAGKTARVQATLAP